MQNTTLCCTSLFCCMLTQWRRQLLEFTRSWQGPENICQVLSICVGNGGQLASPPKKSGKYFSGKNRVNSGILLILHAYIFGQNCLAPQNWLSSYAYGILTLHGTKSKQKQIVSDNINGLRWAEFTNCSASIQYSTGWTVKSKLQSFTTSSNSEQFSWFFQ